MEHKTLSTARFKIEETGRLEDHCNNKLKRKKLKLHMNVQESDFFIR